jgi:hypothetical protein
MLDSIGDEVAGFARGTDDEGQQATDHFQQTEGD